MSDTPPAPSQPPSLVELALSTFKQCPKCRAPDYILFDGCALCGYKNTFADHALRSVPGTALGFAAWDTMFLLEHMAGDVYADHLPAAPAAPQASAPAQPQRKPQPAPPAANAPPPSLRSRDEIYQYLCSTREHERRIRIEHGSSYKERLQQSLSQLATTLPPALLPSFTAFTELEMAFVEFQIQSNLVQAPLVSLATLLEQDISLGEAKAAAQKFLSFYRSDMTDYQHSLTEVLTALTRTRRLVFNPG